MNCVLGINGPTVRLAKAAFCKWAINDGEYRRWLFRPIFRMQPDAGNTIVVSEFNAAIFQHGFECGQSVAVFAGYLSFAFNPFDSENSYSRFSRQGAGGPPQERAGSPDLRARYCYCLSSPGSISR